MNIKKAGATNADKLKHLTLAIQPLTLADLPAHVLSMAWKAPGEFGFRRRASADASVRTEDRVRHYRDQVWPKRERFVNQILNGILMAAPPAVLASVAFGLGFSPAMQAPALHKLSTRKLGRFVGEPDFVLFDPKTQSIVLGEIKIGASLGNDRYSFEQYTKYMLLGALLRAAGLAKQVAHLVIVPVADPKAFCKDYKKWLPTVTNGRLQVSPDQIPTVRRREKVLYSDRISWVAHAVEFLRQPKIQSANDYGDDAIVLLGLEEHGPALWMTGVAAWDTFTQDFDAACAMNGAQQLRPSIRMLGKIACGSQATSSS